MEKIMKGENLWKEGVKKESEAIHLEQVSSMRRMEMEREKEDEQERNESFRRKRKVLSSVMCR